MRTTLSIFAVVFVAVFSVGKAQVTLLPINFKAGLEAGAYDAVIDVRSETDWETVGHIENATLVADLATTGSPDFIMGCKTCTIVVYDINGNRARQAISRLINEFGFNGTLYNGQGVSQWQVAGFELVFTESADPPCVECGQCSGTCPQTTGRTPSQVERSGATSGPLSLLGVSAMAMIVAGVAGHWVL